MPKVLVVDDDIGVADELRQSLSSAGWQVETCESGFDALQLLRNFQYDFVLLDWNLPDTTGPQICSQFRKDGGVTPIIFLTGRQSISDIEHGLDCGGDDYLTKPFDARELLARIRSVQRRPAQLKQGKYIVGKLEFNPKLRVVKLGDEQVQLSPTESGLLETICQKPNNFFSSAALFQAVWPSNTDSSEDIVRTHMKVLRRKLKLLTEVELIETVRGSGYLMRAENVQSL